MWNCSPCQPTYSILKTDVFTFSYYVSIYIVHVLNLHEKVHLIRKTEP